VRNKKKREATEIRTLLRSLAANPRQTKCSTLICKKCVVEYTTEGIHYWRRVSGSQGGEYRDGFSEFLYRVV
jgi:hypothetical protein